MHDLQSSKEQKYKISEIVVDSLKSKGARFLRENKDGGWYEIPHYDARRKVSQALRERLPKGILKNANDMAIDVPLNDGTYVVSTDEALHLASDLLDHVADLDGISNSRPLSLSNGDRISTGEYTKMMNGPICTSSGNWSTGLYGTGTGPITEPVNPSILDGQMPDLGSVESDTVDQETSKTRGRIDTAKEEKTSGLSCRLPVCL